MIELLGNIPPEFDLILASDCSQQQVTVLACNADDQGRAIDAGSCQVINQWLRDIKKSRALAPPAVASDGLPNPELTSTPLGLAVGGRDVPSSSSTGQNSLTHDQRFFGGTDPTARDQRSIERGSEDPGHGPNSVA